MTNTGSSITRLSSHASHHTPHIRFVYPVYCKHHTTLSLVDISKRKSRVRLSSIDSLKWHLDDIRAAFEKWQEHTLSLKPAICLLNGGEQGKNETECGVFTLMNMDAVLKQPLFFDVGKWDRDAAKRSVECCKGARNGYTSILRHHCVQWFRDKSAVVLMPSIPVSKSAKSANATLRNVIFYPHCTSHFSHHSPRITRLASHASHHTGNCCCFR